MEGELLEEIEEEHGYERAHAQQRIITLSNHHEKQLHLHSKRIIC